MSCDCSLELHEEILQAQRSNGSYIRNKAGICVFLTNRSEVSKHMLTPGCPIKTLGCWEIAAYMSRIQTPPDNISRIQKYMIRDQYDMGGQIIVSKTLKLGQFPSQGLRDLSFGV